jgi:WD40 repeat protein
MKSESDYFRVLTGFFLLLCAWVTAVPQRARSGAVVDGASDVAFDIKFSPDGKTLAIARGATDPTQQFGRIELWDTDTGSLRRVIQGFDGPVRSITFTPDSKTIISGSLEYHPEKLQQKATSRSGDVSSEVKWWDVTTGDLKQKSEVSTEGSISIMVECSPDGKQIAVVQTLQQYSAMRAQSDTQRVGPPRGSGHFYFNPFSTSELRLLDGASGQQKTKVNIKSPGTLA